MIFPGLFSSRTLLSFTVCKCGIKLYKENAQELFLKGWDAPLGLQKIHCSSKYGMSKKILDPSAVIAKRTLKARQS